MLASDTGHQFATSLIYAAPALNGRRWYVKQTLGGWQISGIYQHRGGLPFSVNSSQTMNDDINGSRANLSLANCRARIGTSISGSTPRRSPLRPTIRGAIPA
jgi:hypothetical protein